MHKNHLYLWFLHAQPWLINMYFLDLPRFSHYIPTSCQPWGSQFRGRRRIPEKLSKICCRSSCLVARSFTTLQAKTSS